MQYYSKQLHIQLLLKLIVIWSLFVAMNYDFKKWTNENLITVTCVFVLVLLYNLTAC